MLEKLTKKAFRIHIEPFKTVDHAAKVETVIKVLSDITQSYNNYLEIEFFKKPDFVKAFEANKNVLETIKEELSLLIVDLQFGSFEAALAPNLTEPFSPIFKNEVLEWKQEIFEDYKEYFIEADYNDIAYVTKIAKRYTEDERARIYKPLFSSIGDRKEYQLNIKNSNRKVVRTLSQPATNKEFFIPKVVQEKPQEPIYSTVQVYAKVKKQGDTFDINKRTLKEILYLQELEHETYPFNPDIIRFEGKIYVLNKKLNCTVEFEDKHYIISNDELDVLVWGDTRKEAEEAFSFNFYSLYHNYYLEKDENLSAEAIELKANLKKLIKSVVDEA